MTDNAELVHFEHGGIHFSALVELLPDDEEVAIFYDECDVTELLPLFDSRVRYNIERMAVKSAMKRIEERAKDNKHEDSLDV